MTPEAFGFFSAFVIGVLLSLLGGGGSILTVPLLVYVFHLPPSLATAYSLLIVGISSLVGSLTYLAKDLASPKTALFFSFPSFAMVFAMRKYIMPAIPLEVKIYQNWYIQKELLIMTVFSLLMLSASMSMIKSSKKLTENISAITKRINYPIIFFEGLVVGALTGFVGVGGGFLIIPVLTLFVNLPMKMAVGTSLMIIAINSCFGFLGDIGTHTIDWAFVGVMICISVSGVLVGSYLSKYVQNKHLKPAFGWLTLAMGCGILLKEYFL